MACKTAHERQKDMAKARGRTLKQLSKKRRILVLDGSSGPPQPTSFSSVVWQDTWNDRLIPSQSQPTPDVSNTAATISYTGNVSCVDNSTNMLADDISVLRFVTLGARPNCPDNAAYTIGSQDFWVEAFVNWDTFGTSQLPTASSQGGACIMQHYLNTGNQRSWYFSIESSGAIQFAGSTDGAAQDIQCTTAPLTWTKDTIYHLAVSRQSGVIRIFLDGVQQDLVTNTNPGGTFHDSTYLLALGFLYSSSGFQRHFQGLMAHTRFGIGEAVYTQDFTVPTAPHPTSQEELDAL